MPKFRKLPVTIEAEQFIGVGHKPYPPGICFCDEVLRVHDTVSPHAHIHTLEGIMLASCDDWIIKGVAGEFYPCKPDVFVATYEPVDPMERMVQLRYVERKSLPFDPNDY